MSWSTPFKDRAEFACKNLFGTQVPPPLIVKLFGPTSTALPSKGKSKTSDELKGVVSWAPADKPSKRTELIARISKNDFVVFKFFSFRP